MSAAFAADGDSGVSASEEGTFTVITCSFLKKILDPTYQIVKDLGRLNLTDALPAAAAALHHHHHLLLLVLLLLLLLLLLIVIIMLLPLLLLLLLLPRLIIGITCSCSSSCSCSCCS